MSSNNEESDFTMSRRKQNKRIYEAKSKTIYILTYTNLGTTMDGVPCWKQCLIGSQMAMTNSSTMHILIGMPEEIIMLEAIVDENDDIVIDPETNEECWKENSYPITCYETCVGQCVIKHGKSLNHYEKNSIEIDVTPTQYEALYKFLEFHCAQETPFNMWAYVFNFTICRWYPIEGFGFFCAQLVAEALHDAGIINMDRKYVKTKGYLETLCCCPSGKRKRVIIPPSYQMTVEMIFDIIKEDNRKYRYLNDERNPNEVAQHSIDQKKRRTNKKYRSRKDIIGEETIYHPIDNEDRENTKKILERFRYRGDEPDLES